MIQLHGIGHQMFQSFPWEPSILAVCPVFMDILCVSYVCCMLIYVVCVVYLCVACAFCVHVFHGFVYLLFCVFCLYLCVFCICTCVLSLSTYMLFVCLVYLYFICVHALHLCALHLCALFIHTLYVPCLYTCFKYMFCACSMRTYSVFMYICGMCVCASLRSNSASTAHSVLMVKISGQCKREMVWVLYSLNFLLLL